MDSKSYCYHDCEHYCSHDYQAMLRRQHSARLTANRVANQNITDAIQSKVTVSDEELRSLISLQNAITARLAQV